MSLANLVGPTLGIAGLAAATASIACGLLMFSPKMLTLAIHESPINPINNEMHEPHNETKGASAGAQAPDASNKSELAEPQTTGVEPVANVANTEPTLPGNFSCPPVEVIFGPSSTSLGSAVQATLEPLAHWMAAHASAKVVVEGHADRRGPEDANLWVSHERARIVAMTLAKYGVAEERLVQQGAPAKPTGSTENSDARQDTRQRRVVISVKNSSGECPPLVVAAGGAL